MNMPTYNPYCHQLMMMGYDAADVYAAAEVVLPHEFPLTIYGRTYDTKDEYEAAVREFLNSLET